MTRTNTLTGLQIGRLVLYCIAVVAGLAGVVAETLGYADVASTVNGLSAALLVMTGGTAALNIEKGKQQMNPVEVLDTIGAVATAAVTVNQAETARNAADEAAGEAQPATPARSSYITVEELRGMM